MDIGFLAVETFIPPQNYLDGSKLYQLKEVVSFDCCLCPSLTEYSEDEYPQLLWMGHFWAYKNLDFLLNKVEGKDDKQILAVIREPEADCTNFFIDTRFHFYGYDLIEDDSYISALTNCGGFDMAFLPSDISQYGLIESLQKLKKCS